MKAVESEGTSVEEAVNRALLLLGLDADQVEVSVIRDPTENGRGETAIVRVMPKDSAGNAPVASSEADESVSEMPGKGHDVSLDHSEETVVVVARDAHPSRHGRSRAASPRNVSGETGASPDGEVPLTEEEGERADRAGDFLEDLFELMNIDCYVEVAADRVEGKVLIDVAGPDSGAVIGRKGAMLDAVELVLNRAMDNVDGGGIRIALDAEGYRERRTEKLRALAGEQARKAVQTKRPVALEPMSARERRIIHIALEGHSSVRTRSEDEGPDRHVVIEPIEGRTAR
jgi:spoIIIJ-associated protein